VTATCYQQLFHCNRTKEKGDSNLLPLLSSLQQNQKEKGNGNLLPSPSLL
jgi:hypothetical protein